MILSWEFSEADLKLLRENHLYKSLSILLAKTVANNVPETAIILDKQDIEDIARIIKRRWGGRCVLRFDYTKYPKRKLLGGMIFSVAELEEILPEIMTNGMYPVIHEPIDRFKNIYSANAIYNHERNITIEIVGSGFDSGDLRLGLVTPHEIIRFSLNKWSTEKVYVTDSETYERTRKARICIRKVYQTLHDLAKNTRRLPTLDTAKKALHRCLQTQNLSVNKEIPTKYETMPDPILKRLLHLLSRLVDIVPHLPPSKNYVFSLSFTPEKNAWVLWDIYGRWYVR